MISTALALVLAAAVPAPAQQPATGAGNQSAVGTSHAPRGPRAEVRSVTVTSDDFGPVVEILATRPISPEIQTVESPLRLVIDLPNSTLSTPKRRIPFRNQQIKDVRVNQYQTDPAVARVVLDLVGPVRYTWDATGSRLHIRIRSDQAATAKPPSIPALTSGVQPAAVPVAVGSSGSLVETGSRVASGSSITAGEETAIMRLTRGGEVRVCPGTTVSFTTSANGNDLLLGMSRGTIETNYGLQESVDSVLTPDFRIVLPGPGEFNLAISADARGDTCVSSLPGTTSSAVVAELLGSGTYEIKPQQQVMFRRGRLDSIETPIVPCGCPAAPEPATRTENEPKSVTPDEKASEKLELANANSADPSGSVPSPSGDGNPRSKSNAADDADAPLVFSGLARAKAATNAASASPSRADAPAAAITQVAALHLSARSEPRPAVVVLPPAPDPKSQKKGFMGKVKGFFGSIFR